MAIRTFTKKPVQVFAEQFRGWTNAEELLAWLPGAFFVPRGYEHHMRLTNEFDRSRGDVLEDAPPYLVLNEGNVKSRVDEYYWIVKDIDGRVTVLSTEQLKEQYDLEAGQNNYGLG